MKDALSILYIFRDMQNHDHIYSILEQAGHTPYFIKSENKTDFKKALLTGTPDIILCDLELNGQSPVEILSIRNEQNSHIPFIVTGNINFDALPNELAEDEAIDFVPTNQLHLLPYIIEKQLDKIESKNGRKVAHEDNQLLYSVINRSLNEFFLMDTEDFRFIFANDALLGNMGYTKADFLKLNFSDTVADHHKELVTNMTEDFWKGKLRKITFQKDSLRSDGSYYPVHIHLEYISNGEREIISGECLDLSHRKRQEAMLEQEKHLTRELRLSNKFKSNFFANLSHEMRTTLNTVQLLSQILADNKDNNLSQNQLNYAESIHNSTNSLLALLNEVLDMSKIESGKMNISLEYVELQAFCKELERLFQPVASEKGITFEFINTLSEDLPYKTDRLRLEQVLKNLISNALKFTREGSVKLKVYEASPSEMKSLPKKIDRPVIAFQVSDTGIGIPEDKQKQIFESYSQAKDDATTKEFGGTGLGLSISSEIVRILGGKIDLESEEGSGSTFTLYMPLDSSGAILRHAKEGNIKLSTAPAPSMDVESKKKTKGSGKIEGTILLVDDNVNHNMALKEYLGFKIKNCVTAQSAKEAYEILETQPVNCIILDMYLPDADGKEVLRTLKKDNNHPEIPVIIYSGKSLSQNEEEELEKLADAIIQKNVMSYKLLLSKITGILHKANYSPPE